MISVLDHIEYLMTEHDCVIVPGLGAFISQYSVERNRKTNAICSIKRNIAFNGSVDYNDGLLINSIVRRESVGFERARCEVNDYVRALYGQLKYEGEVPVGRLGYFSSSEEGALEFFPFMSKKANDNFFGLLPIEMKPLSEMAIEPEQKQTNRKDNVIRIARRFVQAAASVILLIGMALVLSTPMVDRADSEQNFADFNAFSIKNASEVSQMGELFIAMPAMQKEADEMPEAEVVAELNAGKYALVVASLVSEKQVEKFVKESGLRCYDVVKSKSKYRVFIARGSYEEMNNLKNSEYSDSDAWVCRL